MNRRELGIRNDEENRARATKCPAIELLAEIRDHLRNLDTLAQRRAKDRERKRLVRGQEICPRTKEDEKGKETFPPSPPIEKRAKDEERLSLPRTHARFVPPTPEEVAAYCRERHNNIDPVLWWNFYQAKGWKIGNNRMVDWRRAVITWERNRKATENPMAAAFERETAEVKARQQSAAALAERLLAGTKALAEGGAS